MAGIRDFRVCNKIFSRWNHYHSRFIAHSLHQDSSSFNFPGYQLSKMGDKSVILRVLASAVSIVNKSGQIIKDIMNKGDLGIIDKGINDPQTEADRSVQKLIVQSLQVKFPELTIIGEEDLSDSSIPEDWVVKDEAEEILCLECPQDYKTISEKDIVAWVDPLDGTREFTIGFLDHVTVLIGFSVAGRPICGVIHQPYYEQDGEAVGRTIWGIKDGGYGGFKLEPPLSVADKLILTVTRSHSDKVLENTLTKLNPSEIVRVGGAGHKVLLILDGKVHAYIHPSKGLKRWDTCAPEAILESVGGILTDWHGNNYSYNKESTYSNDNGIIAALTKETQEKIRNLLA